MPNWSHGQAGITALLAAAGIALKRADLIALATSGAEHLLTLADFGDGGLRLPLRIPGNPDLDTFTYSWCHGPAGTSLRFAALEMAAVPNVGDRLRPTWSARACTRCDQDLDLAGTLGDALVDRAVRDGDHAYWRFVEHRNADPLRPLGPGWMQGAAGIATYLFRLARLVGEGLDVEAVKRMDTWWALPRETAGPLSRGPCSEHPTS